MAALPETFKAVRLPAPNAPFKLVDVPLKHPGPREVLVKVRACGLCFSDIAIAAGEFGDVFPLTLGHEVVGDVVELGSDVKSIKLGQRVGGPWHGGHDGTCTSCKRGNFYICENSYVNGFSGDGGWAEYVILREEGVVRVPADMEPAEVAPLLCSGITVFNSLRKQHIEQGALVAVQGLGALGHLAVQYANKMGYEVVVLSSGDDKAPLAKQLGAHHYINTKASDTVAELTKLGGAECIIQTAPNPKAIGELTKGLKNGGKLLILSTVGDVSIDTTTLVIRGLSVQGWPSGSAIDSEDAIAFAKVHGVKAMIQTFPLADVQKAVDNFKEGKPRFKNVLVMD